MGKYAALFDAEPAAPADAASPAPAAAGAGKYAALFDDTPDHAAPIDQPGGIGLSGPGSKDTDPVKLAPTARPTMVASESKVPGHQGESESPDSAAAETLAVLGGAKETVKSLYGSLNDAGNQMAEIGIGAGKRIAANPLAGPGEAFQDTLADPRLQRQVMRGVNNWIAPVVGNKLVAAVGGPPERSEADAAAFPRGEALGGVIGAVVPVPIGEIAAAAVKPAKAAARGLLGAVERIGAGAQERRIGRAVEDITEGSLKKQRLGLQQSEDKVEALARENPEIIAHARDNDALAKDAEDIRKRASAKLEGVYGEADAAQRKPVATDIIAKAEQEEDRAAAAKAEAAANPAGSEARVKAEQEAAEAKERAQGFRREAAKRITDSRAHGIDPSESVANMDASISDLRRDGSTSKDRAVADALEKIRDEFADAHGGEGAAKIVPAKALRAQQSTYQTAGYATVMPGIKDADVAQAQILANRQASRDVGDSIVRHVTGMGYDEAKAAAAADPNSIAARLFKLNGEVEGAARIQAAVASKNARSHSGFANFMNLIFHGRAHAGAAGTLSAASLLAHESGFPNVGHALGMAAGAVTAAPKVARYADNALAAAGRGAQAASAALTPAAVNEVIDLAAAPSSSFADVVAAGTKRGLPVRVAAQIATSAGKASPAIAPAGPPLMAQQEASP